MNQAKRILIIGCPGSGKSTFARALHQLNSLPLYHLDLLYWNADKTTVTQDVFRQRLQIILQKPCWIIDGNYVGTLEMRLQQCDTVYFLDYPAAICKAGVRERFGKPREDMPWIETEEDPEFMSYIDLFESDYKPKIQQLLQHFSHKQIIVFQSRAESDRYLEQIK